MPCERAELLQHLAVTEPETLKAPAWRQHLADCASCSKLLFSMERSLAVFQQLESESRAGCPLGPTWQTLQHKLQQHSRRSRTLRQVLPTVAAASLLVLVAGVVSLSWHRGAAPRIANRQAVAAVPASLQASLQGAQQVTAVARKEYRGLLVHRFGDTPPVAVTTPVIFPTAVFPTAQAEQAAPAARAPVVLFRSLRQMRSIQEGGFGQTGSAQRGSPVLNTSNSVSVSYGNAQAYLPRALPLGR